MGWQSAAAEAIGDGLSVLSGSRLRRRKIRCRSRRTSSSTRVDESTASQSMICPQSVHRHGVQLAHPVLASPDRLSPGSPGPRRLPRAGHTPVSERLCVSHRRKAESCGCRFPSPSACRRRFLGHPAPAGELRLPHGRPTGGDHRTPTGLSCCAVWLRLTPQVIADGYSRLYTL